MISLSIHQAVIVGLLIFGVGVYFGGMLMALCAAASRQDEQGGMDSG